MERGGALSDWEVKYLISNNKNDDLKKYIEKGKNISDENFSKLGDELKEVYLRCRMFGVEHNKGLERDKGLEDWEVGYLISNNKNDDLKKYFEMGYSISYENFNKLSEELKELYIVNRSERAGKDDWHSKLSSKYKRLHSNNRFRLIRNALIDKILPK